MGRCTATHWFVSPPNRPTEYCCLPQDHLGDCVFVTLDKIAAPRPEPTVYTFKRSDVELGHSDSAAALGLVLLLAFIAVGAVVLWLVLSP